jgi:acyl-CoA dehydrogenase
MKDIDMMLTVGDIFTSIVYGQLILESAKIQGISDHLVDQIFDCLIRDVSGYAVAFHTKRSSTPEQMEASLKIVRKPALNPDRDEAVWAEVLGYKDAYEMRR